MLSLRKYDELYQWDTGRALLISPDSNGNTPFQVEFEYNGVAIVVSPKRVKSEMLVQIPDLCLQSSGFLIVYEVININGHVTYNRHSFVVKAKSRPNDYVCNEPDVITWHELDSRIAALENSIDTINKTVTEETFRNGTI